MNTALSIHHPEAEPIETSSTPRPQIMIYAALTLVSILGIAFRLHHLGDPIGWDEARYAHYMRTFELSEIIGYYDNIGNHLFFSILVKICYLFFGDNLTSLRLVAFLSGSLLIPATFFSLRRLSSPITALVVTGLVSILPVFILASTNARGYILQTLLTVLLIPSLMRLVNRFSVTNFVVFGTILFLSFYTLPHTLYIVPGLFVAGCLISPLPTFQTAKRLCLAFSITALPVMFVYGHAIFTSGVKDVASQTTLYPLSPSENYELVNLHFGGLWSELFFGLPLGLQFIFAFTFLVGIAFGLARKEPTAWFLFSSFVFTVLISFLFVRLSPPRGFLFVTPLILLVTLHGLRYILEASKNAVGILAQRSSISNKYPPPLKNRILLTSPSHAEPGISTGGGYTYEKLFDRNTLSLSRTQAAAIFLGILTLSSLHLITSDLMRDLNVEYTRLKGAQEVSEVLIRHREPGDLYLNVIPQVSYWATINGDSRKPFPKLSPERYAKSPSKRVFLLVRRDREMMRGRIEDLSWVVERNQKRIPSTIPHRQLLTAPLWKSIDELDIYLYSGAA